LPADIPTAVVFGIAQSRFTLRAQAVFLIANGVGLSLGAVYNAKTPDLYENNAHHKMGWIFTWFALAWVTIGVINTCAARFCRRWHHPDDAMNLTDSMHYQRLYCGQSTPEQRWSQDSVQHIGQNFGARSVSDLSSTESEVKPYDHEHTMYSFNDMEDETCQPKQRGFLNIIRVEKYLSKKINHVTFKKIIAFSDIIYLILERLFVIIAFTVLATGIITFGGIFVSLREHYWMNQ
jgi:hypothetical protein